MNGSGIYCNLDRIIYLLIYLPIFFQDNIQWIILIILFQTLNMGDALRNLVPFVQFKKREKHPWGSVNFSEAWNFIKINTPPRLFFISWK